MYLLQGCKLNYYADLSSGGFVINESSWQKDVLVAQDEISFLCLKIMKYIKDKN